MSGPPVVAGDRGPEDRALDALALLAALAALVVYAAGALELVRYPWDWAPDEGLTLDYARRLVHAPATLFSRSVVPVPIGYPPLLAALLVPFVEGSARPLLGARLLACAWTGVLVASVYVLVRRAGSGRAALLAAALVLAPVDLSFWYLIVRPDGLMIALWLLSAAVLLPERLARGGGHLSWPRALAGGMVLLAAVAAKPTAALHGAPLALGWLLVDRRSAARLISVLLAGGIAVLAVLQVASDGGFFHVLRLWGLHVRQPGLASLILALFAKLAGVALVFALAGAWAGLRPGRAVPDPALLLVAGGLLALPALSKVGAWWNYLLPAFCAFIVLGGRGWAAAKASSPRVERLGAAAGVALVAALLLTRSFPVPRAEDETTAAAFYAHLKGRGAPILAIWPEYAYFVLGQPVEMEGSGFPYLAAARAAGIETLLGRLRAGAYRTISLVTHLWPNDPEFERALSGYRPQGVCELGYFYGRIRFVLLVPAGDPAVFAPPAGARCQGFAAP
jgi:4-amino-4-deoxy-L-arabinose transferase-like glycosyltransferase